MKRSLLGLFVILAVLFSSCKRGGGSLFTPTSSGLPYELVVVADDSVWDGEPGKALKDVLQSDIPGLPQSESYFYVMHVNPSNFDNTMKLLRNVIMVRISDDYTTAKIKYDYDIYSNPQVVMTIQARDNEQFITAVKNSKDVILNLFNNAEMNRYVNSLKDKHHDGISKYAAEHFNLEIWAPVDMRRFKEGKDFYWASNDAATGNQNIIIYSYPYTTRDAFTKEYFIAKRDSFMKANIPGAHEDSYMTTDSLTVETKDIAVQGQYAMEARGLWKMKGDFMGGPFVSHSMVDTLNNRIVVGEVFVYEPKKMKRRYIRQMESALFSMKFLDNKLSED